MVMASWYALITQIDIAGEVFRSRAIEGRATLAIVPSSTDIATPKAVANIAQYRFGKGRPSKLFTSLIRLWIIRYFFFCHYLVA